MKYEDIPDYIQLKSVQDGYYSVSIGYSFDGKPRIIEVEKNDKDENWKRMDGKINSWRAFQVAIATEEENWNREQAKASTAPLMDFFNSINRHFK